MRSGKELLEDKKDSFTNLKKIQKDIESLKIKEDFMKTDHYCKSMLSNIWLGEFSILMTQVTGFAISKESMLNILNEEQFKQKTKEGAE